MAEIQGTPEVPKISSQEYLWWYAGARAECEARDEGLPFKIRDFRDMIADLYRLHPGSTEEELALTLVRIYCPDKLRRKYR
jgi:hypothetical protein